MRGCVGRGEALVEVGEHADAVYFVRRGQFGVVVGEHSTADNPEPPPSDSSILRHDGEKLVNVLGAGCSVGQMGVVMEQARRTASVRALTDGEVF